MANIFKIWGERHRILLTDKTEIDLLYTKKNTFCSTHKHKNKINKFHVVTGKVRIETEFGSKVLNPGESWIVEPPLKHRFFNLEDSIMIELAYVNRGKIDPRDIERESQGGKVIKGKEYTFNEMRKRGWLKI